MTRLKELAYVRSKNSQPFLTTIDLFFTQKEDYLRVKKSDLITKEKVAEIYNVPQEVVYGVFPVDNAMVIKVTLFKYGKYGYMSSGDVENPDHFGTQQHVPLLDLEVP